MIKCPQCGNWNEDGSLFCAECGTNLQFQNQLPQKNQKSSPNPLLFVILGMISLLFIGGMILLAVKFVLPAIKTNQAVLETEAKDSSLDTSEKDIEAETSGTEALESANQSTGNLGANADVNAVETAIFEINGVVKAKDGNVYLKLSQPVSVYACNEQNEPVYLENVSRFLLKDVQDIEECNGCGVAVKGSVSIGEDNQAVLSMSKYTLTQAAEEDAAIHRYVLVIKDCTWQEAMGECEAMGGYLARVNSYEEYAAIIRQIESEETYGNVHFYLGGRREENQTDYYWVDGKNTPIGTRLNDSSLWTNEVWMEGEPSYLDGEAEEMYLNLFYYEKEAAWVLNDVPEDVSVYYPGKTGYICEFEN